LVAKEHLEYRGRLTAIPSKPEFGAARAHGQEVIEGGIGAAPEYGIAARANSVDGDPAADGKREGVFQTRRTFRRAKDTANRNIVYQGGRYLNFSISRARPGAADN
jgi:hypothetical protein